MFLWNCVGAAESSGAIREIAMRPWGNWVGMGSGMGCHELFHLDRQPVPINSLASEGCDCSLKLSNFQLISRRDILTISCETDPIWMSQDLTDDQSTLVKVMVKYFFINVQNMLSLTPLYFFIKNISLEANPRKLIHYWWSYISFALEYREFTGMLKPLFYCARCHLSLSRCMQCKWDQSHSRSASESFFIMIFL